VFRREPETISATGHAWQKNSELAALSRCVIEKDTVGELGRRV
jgi:hypothetical protein